MAKTPTAVKAPSAAPAAAPLFRIDRGVALPTIERKTGAAASPYADFMKTMNLGKTDADLESFFIPTSEVPAAITDTAEREKVAKEEQRKISNRISGIARRLTKADPDMTFALRSRTEDVRDDKGNVVRKDVPGVRVYRVAAEPHAE